MNQYSKNLLMMLTALVCLFGAASPASSSVVISEILYSPASGDNGEEFIEIVNIGGVQEDIAGWCFEGVTFCFDAGTTLDPGEFKLLAADAAVFLATYGLPADGVFVGQLDDAGERLALSDDTPTVIDEVVYDDKPPWPVTPDGLGPSLEVIDLAEDNSTARNWRASIHVDGHTAGQVNSVQATGLPPWIDNIQHPSAPAPSDPIVVTAELFDATTVELHYKIDFAVGEVTLAMADDGASNDGGAGDGVWGATIPGQPAGTLVRYRIVASGATATTTHPGIDDTVTYDGTAVIDPALTSGLPIFHWFIDPGSCNEDSDNPGSACANDAECPNGGCDGYAASIDHTFTDETEPCVLYYDERLYTGAEVRIRGRSARAWAKKHWKFFFAKGHEFEAPGLIERPVDTFNIQGNWSDRSFMREILGWETFRDAGGPWMQTFPVRIERNGQFYGLYTYLEAPDRTWLRRMRLDMNAPRYKAFDNLRLRTLGELPALYEKENPVDGDYTDLFDLINGIDAGGVNYIWENADVPGMVNYLAAQTIMHNNDHILKNYFLYRNLSTNRWVMHPWDLDLTFGRNFIPTSSLNDVIWADEDSLPGEPNTVSPSHPLFGSVGHRPIVDLLNYMINAVLLESQIQQMYYRRLRTLMDDILAPGRYESRIDELEALIEPEHALDLAEWDQFGNNDQTVAAAALILKNDYLVPRRLHLFNTHGVCDIPGPQSTSPRVVINEIMYLPFSGLPDEEYIELYNPSTTEAVDMSGWRLDGVALTIPAGTVILPDDYAVFVKKETAFHADHGTGQFIAAEYPGSLSDTGEALVLRNANGGLVSSVVYEAVGPWPTGPAGGGASLELIDASQAEDRLGNWEASLGNGTPGAPNSVQGVGPSVPRLYINEVLPVNASINQDDALEFDPWIEIYNASSQTVELDGMHLSDSLSTPTLWPIPPDTDLCGKCWLLIFVDGDVGQGPDPLHASFTLSGAGGFVGVFDAAGALIDYVNYPSLPADHSYGRFPDGTAEQRIFTTVTVEAANDVPPSPLILNEYNAVDDAEFLDNFNSDTFWGRVEGNGGDWFELVVTEDGLDVSNWTLEITDNTGPMQDLFNLQFSGNALWTDLRAGTIITVSENLPDDVGYDPLVADWWVNVQAAVGASGTYITPTAFNVSNRSWQLTIRDASSVVVFGPAGEGVTPTGGIGNDEVFKLEEDPSSFITPAADYNDGTSSTFGSPNIYSAGTEQQDFTELRAEGLSTLCTVPDMDGDGICDQLDNCPVVLNADQSDMDGDGIGDLCDACPDDAANDEDGDGWCADQDNCAFVSNDQTDGDGDGVGNECDICPGDADPDQDDEDGDGIGDACDMCPGDPINDPDLDGVCYSVDNCRDDANTNQDDTDMDGAGDVCDPCPLDALDDADFDGFCSNADNCPTILNQNQADEDSDLVGDVCDNCLGLPNPAPQIDTDGDGEGDACDTDDDGDGEPDGTDNCPLHFNPDQTNTDTLGEGDACDADDDDDLEPDVSDNCPLIGNPGQEDGDGDGVGDACDCMPADSSVARAPLQVGASLRLGKTAGGMLTWIRGDHGHVSNVYRGTLTNSTNWTYDETCLAFEITDETLIEITEPAVGSGYYYLVNGRNVCGDGPLGRDSAGTDIIADPICSSAPGDADSDTVGDLQDNCSGLANAAQTDDDFDFFGNPCDNCAAVANPDQRDTNADGEGDACDDDDDGDGVLDSGDNCTTVANAGQEDEDLDGVGDACDDCTDIDGDGLGASGFAQLCPTDPFPLDPLNDIDGDEVSGVTDNCPETANSDQADDDQDGLGDACDACVSDPENDIDDDGICAGPCGAFDLQAVSFASPVETVLVEFGTLMRFLPNLNDPGLGLTWTLPGFNDLPWTSGAYGVGYEAQTGAAALLNSTVPLGTRSVYTRVEFDVSDVNDVEDMFLAVDYDDAFVAWVNGLEIYRSPEMPAGEPLWDLEPLAHESSNGATPNYEPLIDVTAAGVPALVNGTNVLAIGVWNRLSGGSSDLVLVPRLSLNRAPTMTYLANESDPGIGLTWAGEFFNDMSWSGGIYGIGYETGIGAENLIKTSVAMGTQSIYTRARFVIQDITAIDEVLLGVEYDDGFVAWINGTEVLRSDSMPGGDPSWNTSSGLHESSNGPAPDFEPVINISLLAIPLMHDGVNILAIGVWNASVNSSDLVLVPSMSINGIGADNCAYVYNPNQTDADNDGVGDACDNCPNDFNPEQIDSSANGVGDVCDI